VKGNRNVKRVTFSENWLAFLSLDRELPVLEASYECPETRFFRELLLGISVRKEMTSIFSRRELDK